MSVERCRTSGVSLRLPAAVTAVVALVVAALASPPAALAEPARTVEPTVVATIPHDVGAYSEGLVADGAVLYEATGEFGRSQLRQVDPNTGAVIRSADLPPAYFGEGIAVVGDRIVQLLYQNDVALEWDKSTLALVREVPAKQGWGLCYDGARLISSDGSGQLYFHDVNTLAQTSSVAVTRDGQPMTGLNELECVDGQVWAAAWPNDEFVRIDPATGVVNTVLDVSSLWRFGTRDARQVISSIAQIDGDEFLITGKEWPESFRVRVPA
jgi:glutamine cyclotransferase